MSSEFNVVETTIEEIHTAIRGDELTVQELITKYRERIDAYDRNGPELNSVITVNPNSMERAVELDDIFETDGMVGPLHGIPILVKDQAMTAGIRTTFGSEIFSEFVPNSDSAIISRLKEAGAIILGKTNLCDWAAGDAGYSSIVGQTKNPYSLDHDPGGSSAGTGAAIAANLATVGIGEDTGGSIRVPSSCCNLFGIRVTTGLISRSGLSPLVSRQDTAGPMARTVEDLVRVLDVLVGYDSDDSSTGINKINKPDSYHSSIDERGLHNARIGVLRQGFGTDTNPKTKSVNTVIEPKIQSIAEAGAEIIDPVSISDLQAKLDMTWLYGLQSRSDINSFLTTLENPPVSSLDEIYKKGAFPDQMELFDMIIDGPDDPTSSLEYWKKVEAQENLRHDILAVLAEHDLDAIMFPDLKIPPRLHKDLANPQRESDDVADTFLTNTYIASQSICPAISMPAGFTDNGLPVGLELMSAPHNEQGLLSIAAGYEKITNTRQPSTTFPQL